MHTRPVNAQTFFFHSAIWLMTLLFLAGGEDRSFIPVRIDGSNTLMFNQEYPHQSLNLYGIAYGNPHDGFPQDRFSLFPVITFETFDAPAAVSMKDAPFLLEFSGSAGSETGDPMLNTLEGHPHENRDHFTSIIAAGTIPKTPASLYFGYRYTDNYSDRFDEKCALYKKTTGAAMVYTSSGLAYEQHGGFVFAGPVAATALRIHRYHHWGIQPLLFSPVFRSGVTVSPSLFFNLPESTLGIDLSFDRHDDYYNHVTPDRYLDELWSVRGERTLPGGAVAQIRVQRDTRLTPATSAQAVLHDTVSNLLLWTLTGNLYGNYRFGGSVGTRYIRIPRIALDLAYTWDYVPKTRGYTFYDIATPVEYRFREYETARFHSSLHYTDTLFSFPAGVAVWLDYCGMPVGESVRHTDTAVIIYQDTVHNGSRVSFGIRASYRITLLGKLSAHPWGTLAFTPQNRDLFFSLPRHCGVDLGYGKPDNDSLYAGMRIEHRSDASLTYWVADRNETLRYTAPSHTSASFFCTIPFQAPFLRKHIQTGVHVEAGPLRFSKKQRIVEHPNGNPVGPAIALGVNGVITSLPAKK